MAYKKNYNSKQYRRRYRRKPRYTTMGSAAYLAKKALAGVRAIRGIVNSEKKYIDTGIVNSVNSSGAVLALTAIAQGDTNTTRNGNSILCKSVQLRGHVAFDVSTTRNISYRLFLVHDTQQVSDSSPTYSDIFSGGSQPVLNLNHVGRFTILKSWSFAPSEQTQFLIDEWINLGNHHVRYNGTANTDIQKGGLYLVHVSNLTATLPNLVAQARVPFYDN